MELTPYKSRKSPPSPWMSQPTLWQSDILCYGQTPFPPICIPVLKPHSLWPQRALHTMGMEGGPDQCSGYLPAALVLILSSTKSSYVEDTDHDYYVQHGLYSRWLSDASIMRRDGCN